MKKIYSLIILLAILIPGLAQVREWSGGSGAWNDASKWSPFGIPEPTDILLFSDVSATISNVPGLSFRGLHLNNSHIILQAPAQQSTTLTVGYDNSAVAIEINDGASLTIGNNLHLALAFNGKASIEGVLNVQANSKFYTNNGDTTLTIVKGALRSSGEIFSTASTLAFSDESVYEHNADKGMIPSATWSKTSNCTIKGIVTTAPSGLNQTFGNYIWDCEHQSAGSTLGVAIPAEMKGDLVIKNTGNINDPSVFLPLPDNLRIGGAFIINNGNCSSNGKNIIVELAGDLIIQGGNLKSNFLGNTRINIHFSGKQKQVYSKATGSIQGVNFKVLDKACLDLGESVVDGDGDFNVEAGGKLMTAHPEGIAAAGNSGAVQVKGVRIFSHDADYAFTGRTSQLTGTGLPGIVRRLIIENSGGSVASAGVILSKETLVTSELVLLNGFLSTTAEQILIVGEGGTTSGSPDSFVTGPMRKAGSASFVFPTGWAGQEGGRIPIGIELLSSTAVIQAEYKRAPATDKGSTINAPLHHINYCEYWEAFPVTGSPKAIVTMYYNAHSSCSPVSLINDFSSARVARSNGQAWSQIGNAGDSLNGGNGYVVSDNAGISLNKDERFYALGNITTATDPLPVMFDNVMAYEKNNGVNIEWSNLTERDIAIYYVERSTNGMDYTIIGQYLPKSNRDDKASYLSFDGFPAHGTNFYRVKVIEKSTKIIFSKVMRVETGLPGQHLSLYPNPVINNQIMLGLTGLTEGKYDIRVINVLGQPVFQTLIEKKGYFMTQPLRLPSSVPPGIYKMIIAAANYRETKTFIVQ